MIPYGGGGLTAGIASALRARSPQTKIFTAEPQGGAAAAAAWEAGEPVALDYQPSFIDGSGSRRVLDAMWPIVRELIDGALVTSVAQTAAALRLLAERLHVIAEGAGALAPAAALAGLAGSGRIVVIVSGGNIDLSVLARILKERHPEDARTSRPRCFLAPATPTTSATCAPTSCSRCRRPRRSRSTATSCSSRPCTRARSCG